VDTQWDWVKDTPSGLGLFFNDGDLLAFVVKRLKQVPEIDVVDVFTRSNENLVSGDTVLHALAKEPFNETKLEVIMDLLQKGFEPGLKNKAGQNFLDASTIKDHLLQRIRSAPDNWIDGLMSAWIHNIGGE
jgi:hypothetical protein